MTKFLILLSIYWQSAMHNVDPRIVTAMVAVESQFNPAARCGNCVGLMQINVPIWEKALSLDLYKLEDVDYNLEKGLDILCIYYRQTGDIWLALARYNAGYKYDGRPYVRKIKKYLANGR